jgi:fluoride ion exporter CrcB/FEX
MAAVISHELIEARQNPSNGHENSGLAGMLAEPEDFLPIDDHPCGNTPLAAAQPCAELGSGIASEPERMSRVATHLYTISYLIFFSMWGTLARLGLQALTSYPGAPVKTTVFWANFGGSLIMGFLTHDRKLFGPDEVRPAASRTGKRRDGDSGSATDAGSPPVTHGIPVAAMKKSIPLYIGLATGFCGSLTSFSAFIRDAFLGLSNSLPMPSPHDPPSTHVAGSSMRRHPGYGVLAMMAVIVPTPMISLGALQIGAHLALALEPFTPSLSLRVMRRSVDRAMVVLGWLCWLGAIFMAVWPPDRPGASAGRATWAHEAWRGDSLFALVFAPLGCLLRFYASAHLNAVRPTFPPGTFAVNMAGTALAAICLDLQHIPIGRHVECQMLQGLMDGFCGSLTTVSTWVVELRGLRLRHAYFYGLTSVGLGLGLAIIIMGSLRWTTGFQTPLCG